MLTAKKPVIATVEGTTIEDAYVAVGEPVGIRNICALALALFGISNLQRGETVEVELEGRKL
jgi:hypothetical protein